MTTVLQEGKVGYKKKEKTHREKVHEVKGRNWNDAAISQAMPGTASNHQMLGEESFPRVLRSMAYPTHLDLGLLSSRSTR